MSKNQNSSEELIGTPPKPLFIVKRSNNLDATPNEFLNICKHEYTELSETLYDYHVLYLISNDPNKEFEIDVRYPNQVPDIAMSEILKIVEETQGFDDLLDKLKITKSQESNE